MLPLLFFFFFNRYVLEAQESEDVETQYGVVIEKSDQTDLRTYTFNQNITCK